VSPWLGLVAKWDICCLDKLTTAGNFFFFSYCVFKKGTISRPVGLLVSCIVCIISWRRPWWPCGLRRRSADVRFLGLRIRIPLRAWTFFRLLCFLRVVWGLRRADHVRSPTKCESNFMWSRNLKTRKPRCDLGYCAPERAGNTAFKFFLFLTPIYMFSCNFHF
jgi:hypothetical protein